jgi:hypothetical protein
LIYAKMVTKLGDLTVHNVPIRYIKFIPNHVGYLPTIPVPKTFS